MATDGCRRIDGGMQPKPAIFALSRACIARGTGSSNPTPSPAVPQRRNRIRVRPAMNKHEDGCCGAGGAIDVELLDLAGALGDALRLADAAARQLAVAGPAPDQLLAVRRVGGLVMCRIEGRLVVVEKHRRPSLRHLSPPCYAGIFSCASASAWSSGG